MDVVEALPADWTTDPFKLVEKDGYFYGRGSGDDKGGRIAGDGRADEAASAGLQARTATSSFYSPATRKRRARAPSLERPNGASGPRPNMPLTPMRGGGAFTRDGAPLGLWPQTCREDLPDLLFPGPQSRRPQQPSAARQCDLRARRRAQEAAGAPLHAGAERYHARLFHRSARSRKEQSRSARRCAPGLPIQTTARRPTRSRPTRWRSALTRTRCVATMLKGGHADNALPQLAEATVNCRIMPGVEPKVDRGRAPEDGRAECRSHA